MMKMIIILVVVSVVVVVVVDMWLDKGFLPLHQISIRSSSCCFFASCSLSFRLPECGIDVATAALEQRDCRRRPRFLFSSCLCVYMRCVCVCACVWLGDRDCDVVRKKKREKNLFAFFSSSSPYSLALLQSYLIDAIFDDDVLSPFSLSLSRVLLSVGFYLLAKRTLNELWFDDRRERESERARQDNCVHYWNKWSCHGARQNKTTNERERRRNGEGGTSGEIIFCVYHYRHTKNNTRRMSER